MSKFFFGLDGRNRPVYLDSKQARLNKVIPAATRAGKGVCVQMLVPQFVLSGDGAYVFDPKRDSKMPRALASYCERHGLPFQLLDLRYDTPPQLTLLDGLSAREIVMVFSGGFDLADTGQMDRVYRLDDRQAASKVAEIAATKNIRALPDLVRASIGEKSITDAKVFWGFLNELASLPAISAAKGFDFASPFKNGGIVYVMGDPLDPVVKMAQRMLLVRALVHIYQRPRFSKAERHICLVLDEMRHLLSVPACEALGMIQDYSGHSMCLFQSLGDLASCPGLAEEVVRGAVLDNSKLKLVFQSQNDETAQWAAKETCVQSALVESSDKAHHAERSPGQWRTTEVPSIHPNAFKRMPPLTAALIVDGESKIVRVSPLKHLARDFPPVFAGAQAAESLAEKPAESNLI